MFDYKGYGHFLIEGAQMTIIVAVLAMILTIAMGLIGALGKLSRFRWARILADLYTTIIRGVPELVLLLLIYYGGTVLLQHLAGLFGREEPIDINAFVAGVLVIGFIYGAYATETFRGAIMSVPKGQSEAGWAFGMSRFYTFRRMVLPQMVRFALPSFTNNWLVLLKATALVSVIGLADITNLAKQAGAAARGEIPGAAIIFMAFAGFLYLLISTVSLILLRKAEARYSVGVKRGEF